MQGLIRSLEPFYQGISLLCTRAGCTWTGNIYTLRKVLGKDIEGYLVTRKLRSLERRGMLLHRVEKVAHKSIIWTVMLLDVDGRSGQTPAETPEN